MIKKYILAAKIIAFLGIMGIAFAFYFQASNASDRGKRLRTKATQFEQLTPYFTMEWAENNLWDDGKGEVATYAATRTVYGKPRNFDYTYISVKEVFNNEFHTKTDDDKRNDLYDVIKVNAFCRIETMKYPYHYLTSSFFIRKNPFMLHKFATSSQEWCGTTYKEIDLNQGILQMTYHSYWDKEGTGEYSFGRNLLLEDQLIYSLRSLKFSNGLNFEGNVLESQVSSKIGKLAVYKSNFTVSDAGTQRVRNKEYACWKVSVRLAADKVNEYYFEKTYPNICVKQTTWDARNMELTQVLRDAYWQYE